MSGACAMTPVTLYDTGTTYAVDIADPQQPCPLCGCERDGSWLHVVNGKECQENKSRKTLDLSLNTVYTEITPNKEMTR